MRFTQAPVEVTENAELSLGSRLLYVVYLNYCKQHAVCWPGQERLAEILDVSVRQVQRLVSELEAAGLIERGKADVQLEKRTVRRSVVRPKVRVEKEVVNRVVSGVGHDTRVAPDTRVGDYPTPVAATTRHPCRPKYKKEANQKKKNKNAQTGKRFRSRTLPSEAHIAFDEAIRDHAKISLHALRPSAKDAVVSQIKAMAKSSGRKPADVVSALREWIKLRQRQEPPPDPQFVSGIPGILEVMDSQLPVMRKHLGGCEPEGSYWAGRERQRLAEEKWYQEFKKVDQARRDALRRSGETPQRNSR